MAAYQSAESDRFRYRSLMTSLLGLGVLLGCGQTPERRAAAAVERLGGKVKFVGEGADRVVVEVDLSRTPVADADLAPLRPLSRLESLNLSGTAVTDAGLATLRDFGSLKKLNLNLTKISDAGLASLVDLPQLEELYLIETGLTDGSVAQLQRFVHLKRLVLLRTALGPAAVKELRRQLPNTSVEIEPRARNTP